MIGGRVNVLKVSPDAEYILDDGEEEGDWRAAAFSIGWFKKKFDFRHFEDGFDPREDDERRVEKIISYLEESNFKSLGAYPVLILWPNTKDAELIDGWHRLLALIRMGVSDKFMVPVVAKVR